MIYCVDTSCGSVDYSPEYFQGLWAIYIEAIPKSEQKSAKELGTMLNDLNYMVILIVEDAQVVGFLIGYVCMDHNFILLEYMAVDRSRRNGGYGGFLINILKQHGHNRDIIIEVDSPREQANDIEQRRKRIRFYERHGATVIDGLHYILPMDVDGYPSSHMDLMMISSNGGMTVSCMRLRNILASIYCNVYQQDRKDPRIDWMLESLPANISCRPADAVSLNLNVAMLES